MTSNRTQQNLCSWNWEEGAKVAWRRRGRRPPRDITTSLSPSSRRRNPTRMHFLVVHVVVSANAMARPSLRPDRPGRGRRHPVILRMVRGSSTNPLVFSRRRGVIPDRLIPSALQRRPRCGPWLRGRHIPLQAVNLPWLRLLSEARRGRTEAPSVASRQYLGMTPGLATLLAAATVSRTEETRGVEVA